MDGIHSAPRHIKVIADGLIGKPLSTHHLAHSVLRLMVILYHKDDENNEHRSGNGGSFSELTDLNLWV